MPSALVRWYSSTTTRPCSSTPTRRWRPGSAGPSWNAARSPTSSCPPRLVAPVGRDRARTPSPSRSTRVGFRVEAHVVPPLGDLGEPVRRPRGPRAAAAGRTGHDQRHLDAVRREHVGELGRDEPAADDHQPRGQLVDPHDRVARCGSRTSSSPGMDGTIGAAAGRRDELVCGDWSHRSLSSTVSSVTPVNRPVPVVHGHVGVVRVVLPVLRTTRGDRVDPAEDPVPDRRASGRRSARRPRRTGRCADGVRPGRRCSTNILVGMQPTFRQVPPNVPRSTIATFQSRNGRRRSCCPSRSRSQRGRSGGAGSLTGSRSPAHPARPDVSQHTRGGA